MKLTYGYRWFRAKKRLTEAWDAARAADCHEHRQGYVAVLERDEPPSCFVEVNDGYVGVGFLDGSKREYLSYTFDEVEPGRLFLKAATHREFQGESDRVASGTTYNFALDGTVTIEGEDFTTQARSARQIQADVAGNWEPYPAFGQYDSITREDR